MECAGLTIAQNEKQKRSVRVFKREIIENILTWSSPEFLFNVGRKVCKSWANIISYSVFKNTNFSRSPIVFLFRDDESYDKLHYLKVERNNFHVSVFNDNLPRKLMGNSGDGLLLLYDLNGLRLLVTNPSIRRVLRIPNPNTGIYFSTANIAYIPGIRKYKIICTCSPFNDTKWRVFTINNDMAWRTMNNVPDRLPTFSLHVEMFSFTLGSNVVYWFPKEWRNNRRFVIVNLITETFYSVNGPPRVYKTEIFVSLMPMGNQLYAISFPVTTFIYIHLCKLRIWRITNFFCSEWVEDFSCEMSQKLKSHLQDSGMIRFNAWFRSEKILIFTKPRGFKSWRMMAYNFKFGTCHVIKNGSMLRSSILVPHTNSLFSW